METWKQQAGSGVYRLTRGSVEVQIHPNRLDGSVFGERSRERLVHLGYRINSCDKAVALELGQFVALVK